MRLPPPSEHALTVSHALTQRIREQIDRAGGWIGFERYMQHALYEPGLGYYSAGSAKLGPAGDFTTAPELAALFGRLLAGELARLLEPLADPMVLELGAGSGRLAEQLIDTLAGLGFPAIRYRILETSAELAGRQRERLQRFGTRVVWLDRLPPAPFDGVIVANEVADALPVSCFVKRAGAVRPLGVSCHDGELHWAEGPEQAALTAAVDRIELGLGRVLEDGYRSEVCLSLPGWLSSVGATLARGGLLLIDYGLVRREYYHPERSRGTLICHYRHRAHDDPFLWPGLQDISAWVEFSACAEAAAAAGLDVAGFTTQGHFLLERAAADPDALAGASAAELAAFKTLVLPGEMGERFKLLLLTRGLSRAPLPGRDFTARLSA